MFKIPDANINESHMEIVGRLFMVLHVLRLANLFFVSALFNVYDSRCCFSFCSSCVCHA